jgi:hypothetical protein
MLGVDIPWTEYIERVRWQVVVVAMGRHAFSRLREKLSPEAQAEAAALTEQMERALSLANQPLVRLQGVGELGDCKTDRTG